MSPGNLQATFGAAVAAEVPATVAHTVRSAEADDKGSPQIVSPCTNEAGQPRSVDQPRSVNQPRSADESHSVSAEVGGRDGPEPTRFGDWEKRGRCIDF